MSEYMLSDIKGAVRRLGDWDDLYDLLDNGYGGACRPVTLDIDGGVEAALVDETKGDYDSDYEQDVFFVFKVGDQFFRKEGYYSSHSGTYWDGSFFECRPVEKTITAYERL